MQQALVAVRFGQAVTTAQVRHSPLLGVIDCTDDIWNRARSKNDVTLQCHSAYRASISAGDLFGFHNLNSLSTCHSSSEFDSS